MRFKNLAADFGRIGRRRGYVCAVCAHYFAAERLLLIGNLDHVDLAVEIKEGAGHGEGSAPLAGTGLGCDAFESLFLGVVGLGKRGVQLVAAGCIVSFELIEDVSRSSQRFLKIFRVHERRRAIDLVEIMDFLRDVVVRGIVVEFLRHEFFAEDRSKVRCAHRLKGSGVQERSLLGLHVRSYVIPFLRDLVLFQIHLVRYIILLAHIVLLSSRRIKRLLRRLSACLSGCVCVCLKR